METIDKTTNDLQFSKKYPTLKASLRLWGLDWGKILPKNLNSDGIRAQIGTYDEMVQFLSANFNTIYEQDFKETTFLASEKSEAKIKYYESMVDIFLFKDREKVVGIFSCNPVDWNTYYIRNASILPEYQGRNLVQTFLSWVIEEGSKVGVARVETDISPANMVNIHLLNKAKFNITGLNLSERWGSILKMSKFLINQNENVFLEQFCWGVFHQLKTKERGIS